MDMRNDREFGQAVREARQALGISQGGLAAVMRRAGVDGWHQTTVSRVEKGERAVSFTEAVTLAEQLGLQLPAVTPGPVVAAWPWAGMMLSLDRIQAEVDDLRETLERLRPDDGAAALELRRAAAGRFKSYPNAPKLPKSGDITAEMLGSVNSVNSVGGSEG